MERSERELAGWAAGILALVVLGAAPAWAMDESDSYSDRLWVANSPHAMQGCGFRRLDVEHVPRTTPVQRIDGGRRYAARARHPFIVGHRPGQRCGHGRQTSPAYLHLRRPEIPGGLLSLPLEGIGRLEE